MFVFGVSYAVASLSCALPVFLAVTGAASATPTFLSGVLTYVVYGLGMAMLLLVLTIALAVAKGGGGATPPAPAPVRGAAVGDPGAVGCLHHRLLGHEP